MTVTRVDYQNILYLIYFVSLLPHWSFMDNHQLDWTFLDAISIKIKSVQF